MFANIRPAQTKTIEWGWKNKTTKYGVFAHDYPGEIRMPDIMGAFDWTRYEITDKKDRKTCLGTRDMKSVFTTAGRFMGMTDLLLKQPDLSPIADAYVEWNERLLGALGALVKYFMIGDDYAYNAGLFVHPEWWREWIKPHLERLIQAGKSHQCVIIFHSDGDIFEILADLEDLGVDILNYQPVGKMLELSEVHEPTYLGMRLWKNEPDLAAQDNMYEIMKETE